MMSKRVHGRVKKARLAISSKAPLPSKGDSLLPPFSLFFFHTTLGNSQGLASLSYKYIFECTSSTLHIMIVHVTFIFQI